MKRKENVKYKKEREIRRVLQGKREENEGSSKSVGWRGGGKYIVGGKGVDKSLKAYWKYICAGFAKSRIWQYIQRLAYYWEHRQIDRYVTNIVANPIQREQNIYQSGIYQKKV